MNDDLAKEILKRLDRIEEQLDRLNHPARYLSAQKKAALTRAAMHDKDALKVVIKKINGQQ